MPGEFPIDVHNLYLRGNQAYSTTALRQITAQRTPSLQPSTRILNTTVSWTADRWYVALTVEEKYQPRPPLSTQVIALDKELKVFAYLSLGLSIPKPRFLLKQERKFRRLSRKLARRHPGSRNRQRVKDELARFHQKCAAPRVTYLHKLSHTVVHLFGQLLVENLSFDGLRRVPCLGKYWADLAHGEFQRQLRYKSTWE
ncbi:MAG: RNA-guided endonuclease InsQ/TnpB family protein [Candidatus Hodarchaeota archaeon]